jgi:cytochrome c556
MRKALIAAGAAVMLAGPVSALAQAKPEQLVKQRQSAMTLIAKYFGPIAGMAQGKIPYNVDVVSRNATYLENLAQMPWDGFHENSKGEKSAARPEVWSNPKGFQEAADRLQAEAVKLAAAARAKDEGGVKAQWGAVSKACGACHDNFRVKQ